jgi:hypothetical protein
MLIRRDKASPSIQFSLLQKKEDVNTKKNVRISIFGIEKVLGDSRSDH